MPNDELEYLNRALEQDKKVVTLVGGERVINVHHPYKCAGQVCCIHSPSDHHMKEWPQHWRSDRNMMERLCPHGVGHPDPDGHTFITSHGCDGCCTKEF